MKDLVDATPTPEAQGSTRKSSMRPTHEGLVSQVNEIRRLYAEGEVDAALDLAAIVRPSTQGFSLQAVPRVIVTPTQMLALPLDPRTGFLLARIDGFSSLQTLLDVSAMPAGEAMGLLEELIALGAVELVPPAKSS